MHDKYAKDGLVILGTVLDDPKDKKVRQDTLGYLAKMKVPFATPAVTDYDTAMKKIGLQTYPMVYVFNRDNLYVKKLPVYNADGEEAEPATDYDALEKTIATLLKK